MEATKGELTIKTTDDGYGPSDHGSFYEAGIPVLHFFTGSHSDYHKPSDDVDKINFDGAAQIAGMALSIVTQLQSDKIEPDYIKVARKETARGGFSVSLGTIPDYGARGGRCAAVRCARGWGGPPGGLAKGRRDPKARAPGRSHNLDDYMAAFAVLEPEVEIDVGRRARRQARGPQDDPAKAPAAALIAGAAGAAHGR